MSEKIFDEIKRIFPDPSSINVLSWLRIRSVSYLKSRAEGKEISEEKREILEDLFKAYSPERLREAFNRASNLLDAQKSALLSCGYDVFDFLATTTSRLTVGMASEVFGKQIFEVGLSWDPILNLPYIPGSSLKGAFRSHLERERPDLVPLLGSKSEASLVVFLDSYPVRSRYNLIVPEVTTTIYREQEGKIREVEAEPKPVFYPVINTGVTFRILIGGFLSNPPRPSMGDKGRELRNQLGQFLKEVLKKGIGAKTLVGYGLMEIP
jgi:CRISPR-associated protein Cmr6